jgi:hypothetical protein
VIEGEASRGRGREEEEEEEGEGEGEGILQVIEGGAVSFYMNLELLARIRLPRPMTDCFNGRALFLFLSLSFPPSLPPSLPRSLPRSFPRSLPASPLACLTASLPLNRLFIMYLYTPLTSIKPSHQSNPPSRSHEIVLLPFLHLTLVLTFHHAPDRGGLQAGGRVDWGRGNAAEPGYCFPSSLDSPPSSP